LANPSREAIAEALRQTFPNAPDKAEELAVLITQALNNEIDATEAQARFSALSQALPGSLAGKTATGPAALVNFGAGSNIGDLTVGDIAGGNMNKLFVGPTTINITISGGPAKDNETPQRPRVFICHAEADRTLFQQIQQKLHAAGFEVLPDPALLKNNPNAQRARFLWLGLAHAAVVLVSQNALQSEAFVTETRLLTGRYLLRKLTSDRFHLRCILLDSLQVADLQQHNPALADLEGTFLEVNGPAGAADAVLDALQDLKNIKLPETVLENLARQISDELVNTNPVVLNNAAAALGLRILVNEPVESIRRKVSAGLWYTGFNEWELVIKPLIVDTGSKVNIRRLVETVFPSWVNPCSARCLLDVASGRANRRAIVVNGKNIEFVSKSFVRRAYYQSANPDLQWPILIINSWNDPNRDPLKIIHQQIADWLFGPGTGSEITQEDFEGTLASELESKPIFVVLDPMPDPHTLHEIVTAFSYPGLVFFLLSGSSPFPPDLPDALPLDPALTRLEESLASRKYLTLLNIGNQS
jgi:hypothetical protein